MPLEIKSGTTTLFQQTTPPLNWTKITSYNDYTLRVVTGATSSGGSVNFSSVFNTKSISLPGTPTGSIGGTTLTISQIAPHVHQYYTSPSAYPGIYGTSSQLGPRQVINGYNSGTTTTGSHGSYDQAHTHPSGDMSVSWSQTGTLDLRLKYVDMILATRN